MEGCGHCKNAKNELKDEIASGKVIVKSPAEAPTGVRGFPHFKSTVTGREVSGYMKKDQLFKELGESPSTSSPSIPSGPHPSRPSIPSNPHPSRPSFHSGPHPSRPSFHSGPSGPHNSRPSFDSGPSGPSGPSRPSEPEVCDKRYRGYLTLGDTWKKQKNYVT